MDIELGEVICERTFSKVGGGTVTARIGKPQPDRDAFSCPYQVIGLGCDLVRRTVGIDSVQALSLAFRAVGVELYVSDEAKAGDLVWSGGNVKGDLGFPIFERLEDLRPVGASEF